MAKSKKKKLSRYEQTKKHNAICLCVFLLVLCLLAVSLFFSEPLEHIINKSYYEQIEKQKALEESGEIVFNKDDLCVSYVDVKSADAIVIELPDDKIMLIDSAKGNSKDLLLNYLADKIFNDRADKVIDYFIITHPDDDHYGGAVSVLTEYDVKSIYRPKALGYDEGERFKNDGKTTKEDGYKVKGSSSNSTYNKAIEAIYAEVEQGATMQYNEAGIIIQSDNDFSNPYKFTFMSPYMDYYEDSNSYSAVMLLEYKQKQLLFTGDATGVTDDEVVDYANNHGINLKCDILKVAHHGSATNGTSSEEILNLIKPSYAIISCKEGVYNNLPAQSVLDRLEACGVAKENILRTDIVGTVIVGFSTTNQLMVMAGDEIIQFQTGDIVFIHWYYVVIALVVLSASITLSQMRIIKKV